MQTDLWCLDIGNMSNRKRRCGARLVGAAAHATKVKYWRFLLPRYVSRPSCHTKQCRCSPPVLSEWRESNNGGNHRDDSKNRAKQKEGAAQGCLHLFCCHSRKGVLTTTAPYPAEERITWQPVAGLSKLDKEGMSGQDGPPPRPPSDPPLTSPAPRKLGKTPGPVDSLRQWMNDAGFQAVIVTSDDAHQSEYVSDSDARRSFISGFDGSAGTAVILKDSAFLWTDGRYLIQASKQCDESVWTVKQSMPKGMTIGEHLSTILPPDSKVGIDAFLVPLNTARTMEAKLRENGHQLVALDSNPIDPIWTDRPPLPSGNAFVQPIERCGRSVGEKLTQLREDLARLGAEAMVVPALDECAWLLNVRGNDVAFNPVVISYILVTKESTTWYVDQRKLPEEVKQHLDSSGVTTKEYGEFPSDLDNLAKSSSSILVDPARSSWAISTIISKYTSCKLVEKLSPICEAKAIKNAVEISGLKEAHLKDAVALAQFFCWLEESMAEGATLDEVSVAEELEGLRREQDGFIGPSFETISSYGSNGAIIHYAPRPGSCAKIGKESLYLCDSGGQYTDGTTDVTRTFCFGVPSEHHKMCYTRVLKGHIALSSVTFPAGTTGYNLDILARTPLWSVGLNYKHGTGHGVGAFLNVHEGPHLISYYPRENDPAIKEHFTSSIEPGYYEEGAFGIRIENVAVVVKAFSRGDVDWFTFDPVTFVPLSAKMIDMSLLTPDEVGWVDDYHALCWEKVSPRLSGKALDWLKKNTMPLVTQVYGEDV